jgi:ATP/maltotriose-dependent transcriptional regulator MalT
MVAADRISATTVSARPSFPSRQGDPARARELLEEALTRFRELEDVDQVARCIGLLGNVAVGEGDLDAAEARFEEAAAIARHTEIMEFASAKLGAERAEELRRSGAELTLDDFAALSR